MESSHTPIILHNAADGVTRARLDVNGLTLEYFGTGERGYKKIYLPIEEVRVLADLLVPARYGVVGNADSLNRLSAGLILREPDTDCCDVCQQPRRWHQSREGAHHCVDAKGDYTDTVYVPRP